jgi:CubicO group peptidase (beta-lactamase class C family)
LGELVSELLSKKLGLDFFISTPKTQLSNIAFLYEDKNQNIISSEFNAFNNPEHEINFYNKENWQRAEVPSMNGHGNARSIAKIYDIYVNDLILGKNILLSKSSIKKCLKESISRVDESLMLPIRWSEIGLILRGGWLFGKNKESFGHNGWGGSLGFADPTLGIGVSYTTNKINPTMGLDVRVINLLKEFYKLH